MNSGIYFNRNYLTDTQSYVDRIVGAFADNDNKCRVIDKINDLDGLDVLFVLGGDGTILSIASECAVRNIKILGINYGHVGFLAEFEPEKLDEAIQLVCEGGYKIQKRSMLEVSCGEKTYYALNDAVIQRSTVGNNFCNTVSLHAEIDGVTVDNFSSDGIIISTPTGSTAYSLAAGGAVLTPDINAFILTPICAHSLHSRPIVFNDSSVLNINAVNNNFPLVLNIDGKVADMIEDGQTVHIKKSKYFVEFITKENTNFFSKLLVKLNIWSK